MTPQHEARDRLTELVEKRLERCRLAARRSGFTAAEREAELASYIEAATVPDVRLADLQALLSDPEPAVAVGVERVELETAAREIVQKRGHYAWAYTEKTAVKIVLGVLEDFTALTAPATSLGPPRRHAEIVDFIWQGLLDKDDRTSPEEYPDMALISKGELSGHIAEAMADAAWQASQALSAPSPSGELRKAVEALKPFAMTAAALGDSKDSAIWAGQKPAPQLTFGDFRRAAEVYASLTEGRDIEPKITGAEPLAKSSNGER